MATHILRPASLAPVLMLRLVKDAARSSAMTWSTSKPRETEREARGAKMGFCGAKALIMRYSLGFERERVKDQGKTGSFNSFTPIEF